jgi:hypothetical protein
MQKVEGSSPFIRFKEAPANRGFFITRERIRSERERLLGVMGRAGRPVAREGRLGHYRHKRYRV